MPELPEVQTTVNGLQAIINKEIFEIVINTKKLRYLIPLNVRKIAKNKRIISIYRLAKYIIFNLADDVSLIFHLGMSGRLRILNIADYREKKHDHVLIKLKNNIIILNDPRRFGFFDVSSTSKIQNKNYFVKLGLDPFDNRLNQRYMLDKISNSRVPIKQLLLNQSIISGIGNIYANEILYDAKISPFIPALYLKFSQINQLIKSIRKILKKAIIAGGTSIKNYRSTNGILGNFQNKFKVYDRENKKNYKFRIYKVTQYGRSTFYCPGIQKSKFNPKVS